MVDAKMAGTEKSEDYSIKPEANVAAVDSSQWPLLLKNYHRMIARTGHFTPIPNGSSPLKRDIKSYVSSGVINLVRFCSPPPLPFAPSTTSQRWGKSHHTPIRTSQKHKKKAQTETNTL